MLIPTTTRNDRPHQCLGRDTAKWRDAGEGFETVRLLVPNRILCTELKRISATLCECRQS